MADIANLVLAVDATQVKAASASLDGLTASGARAEVAAVGLATGVKGVGVEASAMAAAAQGSARAAMDQAAGLTASASAARINTMAMRETLVVGRELARGNFTRIPGSLTLLAQGVGSQGGIAAFASSLGIIKQVQNAELSEAATAAATAAAAVENAARRAAANITAADTEVALAEAAVRVAATSQAEAAAQTRLAAAHQAVADAAAEALIAENALAVAQGRATEEGAAAAAAVRTTLGTTGAVLIAVGIAATGATLGFEALKKSVADNGVLKEYADSLGLSAKQMDALKAKTDDFALTFGDVWKGVKKAAEDAFDQSDAWQKFKAGNESAFKSALDHAVNFASQAYGYVAGTYDTIVGVWKNLPHDLGSAFVSAVNVAITQINNLVAAAVSGINTAIHAADKIPGVNIGDVSAGKIALVSGAPAASPQLSFSQNVQKRAAEAKKKIESGLDTIYGDIIDAAEERIKKAGGNPPKGRKPKQAPTDEFDNLSARLDGEILAAKKQLAGTVQEQTKFELQAVDVATKKTIEDAQALLKKKKLTVGEEQHIELQARELDELKKQVILREEATKLLTQAQTAADQQFGFEQDNLKFADEMATTQGAHRKAQLEMLDILYQQKEYDLKILLAKQQIAGDVAAQAVTQAELNHLPTAQAQAASLIQKNTANPLEAWMKSVPQDAQGVIEALQGIEVKGFDGLASAIAGVVTGTESMKQAFGDLAKSIISDIIQMTIKMLIFRALTSLFPGSSSGGGGTGFANGAAFSGGNVVPFATGGVVSSPTLFPMSSGRTGLMGEAGPEAVMPLARDSSGKLGVRAANSNAPTVVELHIVTEPSDDAWGKVGAISVRAVENSAPVIVKAAIQGTMRVASRPKLMGR